jgi:hypothetical protein
MTPLKTEGFTMQTTYTLLDNGYAKRSGLTLEQAAIELLTDDGQEYEIRTDSSEPDTWFLWVRKPNAGRQWQQWGRFHATGGTEEEARSRIFRTVMREYKPGNICVVTDNYHARMVAELSDE